MTAEEVLKLKPGDLVLTNYHNERDVTVQVVYAFVNGNLVYVRRQGKGQNGRLFPQLFRRNHELEHYTKPVPDHLFANVQADYLDELGHYEAAAALRKKFPLEVTTSS